MAQQQTRLVNALDKVDPVWARIRGEAEEVVRREPELASFIYTSILHHDSLEGAIVRRVAERLDHADVSGELIRQDLQRYEPVQSGVLGEVYLSHSAAAELSNDAVMRDRFLRATSLPNLRARPASIRADGGHHATSALFLCPCGSGHSLYGQPLRKSEHVVERRRLE